MPPRSSSAHRRGAAALVAVVTALLLMAPSAFAFGTYNTLGQHAEHEKITRVLSCDAADPLRRCFSPLSLDELAGREGTLGAVGSPDGLGELAAENFAAHCDDGDYLPGFPYTPGDADRAARALDACANLFQTHLNEAVTAAGDLLDPSGRLIADQANIYRYGDGGLTGCGFPKTAAAPRASSAKCRALDGLGRALHAAQDYWSHSNWGDRADPDRPTQLADGARQQGGFGNNIWYAQPRSPATPVWSLSNPAGLGHDELVPWLRFPAPAAARPTAAAIANRTVGVTGCDDSVAQSLKGWAPLSCVGRVGHSVLNKDKGLIHWKYGTTASPDTPRGKVGDNFQRAVTGARLQTEAVWTDLARKLIAEYGETRGEEMTRALTSDTPWTACRVGDNRGNLRGYRAPTGSTKARRSITASIDDRTDQPLHCEVVTLVSGEWSSMPADRVGARAAATYRTESAGAVSKGTGGPEGTVSYRIGTTGYAARFSFDNPIIGSNSFSCEITRDGVRQPASPYRCSVEDPKGNDATPTYLVATR